MSILRLSVLKDTPYAPAADGSIDLGHYQKRTCRGMMAAQRPPALDGPNSDLHHYFSRKLPALTAALPDDGRIVVMVHGFLFDPKMSIAANPEDTDNPHGRVYHFQSDAEEAHEQRHHTTSWPHWLGFSGTDAGESGLAVAFGWQSSPGFASSLIEKFQNFYARAYDYAELSAWPLANVLNTLADFFPAHRIDIFCHSLGSRTVVRALALVAGHGIDSILDRLGQVVVLGGSEYVVEAQLLQRRLIARGFTDAPTFYNFVSRENDVLDVLGENFGPRTFGNTQVIGHNGLDIETRASNWIDMQIDRKELQDWMAARGIEISGDRPGNVWDHWYYYTFRGNMDLYRNIIRDANNWDLDLLRGPANEIPEGVAQRWWDFGD